MSIPETFEFDNRGEVIKYGWFRPYFVATVIVLVALLSFGVGRMTGTNREGVEINFDPNTLGSVETKLQASTSKAGSVTASVNGTKYYYSHCGNNIAEKNRVTFASAIMAEEAGYTLAANCKLR